MNTSSEECSLLVVLTINASVFETVGPVKTDTEVPTVNDVLDPGVRE